MKQTLLILAMALTTCFAYSQTKNFIDQPYIEVNGYADTMITPNEIFIKITISERDTKDKVSVEETEAKMVTGLKGIGINTELDLTTTDLGSNYRFYFLKKKDIIKTKQYVLKVTDAVGASKVFMLLEDLDISNASIERVDHTDLDNIKNIARRKAVENAKLKAVTLTKSLGQTAGSAIYISDTENAATLGNRLQGHVLGLQMRSSKSFDKFEGPPKIEFEKIKVSSTVSVRFVLK